MPRKRKIENDVEKRGKALTDLIQSEGWSIARVSLMKKVASLLNIMDIKNPDPQDIFKVVGSRQLAAGILMEWLKDVEGSVEQHKLNSEEWNKWLVDNTTEYIINNDVER